MTAIVKEKTYLPLGFFLFDPLGDLLFFETHAEAVAVADELVAKYRNSSEEFHDEAAEAVMIGIVLSFPGLVEKAKSPLETGSNGIVMLKH